MAARSQVWATPTSSTALALSEQAEASLAVVPSPSQSLGLRPIKVKDQAVRARSAHQYIYREAYVWNVLEYIGLPASGSMLPKNPSHLAIPDPTALLNFHEIFNMQRIAGVVYTQTSVQHVRKKATRANYKATREALLDPRHECAFFSNESFIETYVERQADQSRDHHTTALLASAALWYSAHCRVGSQGSDCVFPIVVVSDLPEVRAELEGRDPRVLVLTMREYVYQFWSDQPIVDLFESLSASITAAAQNGADDGGVVGRDSQTGFFAYKSMESLEAGIKSGLYFQGALFVNQHKPQANAYVKASDCQDAKLTSSQDILIERVADRNRAVHGDIVVVQLYTDQVELQTTSGQRRGFIVGVIQRRWRDYVATIHADYISNSASRVVVVPIDSKIPSINISLPAKQSLANSRIVVRIDSWSVSSFLPEGHFVRCLGTIGDRLTETQVLLVEHNIEVSDFCAAQLAEMPLDTQEHPWLPSKEEVMARRDIRKSHLVFTIDPIGCEDVDDALCVRKLANGNIELSVHIADVSYFVKPSLSIDDSATDREARQRGTTIYLADRRYDMLPAILSSNICSLLDNVDRYAVSVFWEFDSKMDVRRVWFGRTVIRSQYKLHYDLAQEIFDGMSETDIISQVPPLQLYPQPLQHRKVDELRDAVKLLVLTARGLAHRRMSAGALQLSSQEIDIELDESKQNVVKLAAQKHIELHDTVAECMIFANQAVAERISAVFSAQALLRRHPLPESSNFQALCDLAKSKNFTIDMSSNYALGQSIDRCVDPTDPAFNTMIRSLATRAMSEAKYMCTGMYSPSEWFHYGLSLEHYTHFTSPIRRYADLVVHRQLIASLAVKPNAYEQPPPQHWVSPLDQPDQLQALCDHLNSKNRESKYAQRESDEIFQSYYFEQIKNDLQACEVEGVIMQLTERAFVALVPSLGLRAYVVCADSQGLSVLPVGLLSADARYDHTTSHNVITGAPVRKTDTSLTLSTNTNETFTFRLFDHVRLHVVVKQSRYKFNTLGFVLMGHWGVKPSTTINDVHTPVETTTTKQPLKHQILETIDPTVALRALYGQKDQGNLFNVFERFQELSLRDSDDE